MSVPQPNNKKKFFGPAIKSFFLQTTQYFSHKFYTLITLSTLEQVGVKSLCIINSLVPRQPFVNQRGGQKKRTLSELKKYITEVSGGSVVELLKELYDSKFGLQVFHGIKEASNKLQQLVTQIHSQFNNTINYNKRQ